MSSDISKAEKTKGSILGKIRSIGIISLITVVSVILAAIGLYPVFFDTKIPSITMIATNVTNVLDVHTPLEELTVSFQGQDINKENLNLKILTLKVANTGKIDILQNYYDINDIWGIQINNGKIIDVRLVGSSSEYLNKSLKPQLVQETNLVKFEKVIFERGNYFTIQVLVLHNKTVNPEVVPIGKIAGIDRVEITKQYDEIAEKSLFKP